MPYCDSPFPSNYCFDDCIHVIVGETSVSVDGRFFSDFGTFYYSEIDKLIVARNNKIILKVKPGWDVPGKHRELALSPDSYPKALALFKKVGALIRFSGNNKCEINLL